MHFYFLPQALSIAFAAFVNPFKEKVELFTQEDSAWAPTSSQDNQLYRMMKAGNKAVIIGKSSLGNTTTDTFSLKGFTKAANAIDRACGKK